MNYELIKKENPWQHVAEAWLGRMRSVSGGNYVLKEDEKAFDTYASSSHSPHELVLDVPPQPFVGSPKANIWFLMNNPGHEGEWGHCDLLQGKRALSDAEKVFATDASDSALERRQWLYSRQLRLDGDPGHEFMLLDPSFDTAHSKRTNAKNIYTWYVAQFLPKEGVFQGYVNSESAEEVVAFFSKNLFVLDYFPYHSRTYDPKFPKVEHTKFWRLAIKEALKDERKMFILRGSKIRDVINEDKEMSELFRDAISQKRVLFVSGQRVWLTAANLRFPCPGNDLFAPFIIK